MESLAWYQKIFVHRTNKVVDVYHVGLGATYYALTTAILLYVIYFQIYLNGGYQLCEEATGSVSTAVKGSTVGPMGHVWDAATLVRPGIEPNALFIATKVHVTVGQTEGECIGVSPNSVCTAAGGECKLDSYRDNGKVVSTECFDDDEKPLNPDTDKGKTGHCKLKAWCPIETTSTEDGKQFEVDSLDGVGDFKVFLRANAKFFLHGAHMTNVVGRAPVPGLNQWTVKDILAMTERAIRGGTKAPEEADASARFLSVSRGVDDGNDDTGNKREGDDGESAIRSDLVKDPEEAKGSTAAKENPITLEEVSKAGISILFTVEWDCDLDDDPEKNCEPEYESRRLDRPDTFARGFNYHAISIRHELVSPDSVTSAEARAEAERVVVRDLYHFNGIRILFKTTGVGCKFDFATLTINVGAGLALVAVAAIITDQLLMRFPFWPGVVKIIGPDGKVQTVDKTTALYGIKVSEAIIYDVGGKGDQSVLVQREYEVDCDPLQKPLLGKGLRKVN